jgi:hypothetical protein
MMPSVDEERGGLGSGFVGQVVERRDDSGRKAQKGSCRDSQLGAMTQNVRSQRAQSFPRLSQ